MVQLQNWFYRYNRWSFTKHGLWKECQFAYYLNYIAPALQYSPEFNINNLKSLKKLDGKFILKGKLVHEVIETQLEHFREKGTVDENQAQQEYIKLVEEYRANAEDRIIEFVNGQQVDQYFFDEIRTQGKDQLGVFFGVIWPNIKNYDYLRHEKFDDFEINSTTKVTVKVDYVCKPDTDMIFIYDWKTGQDNPEYENDIQIATYVLWAMDYYKISLEQAQSNLVYLTTGKIYPFQFTEEQLDQVKLLIISDFQSMNLTYDINDFKPLPDPYKCRSCCFSTVCKYSMATTKD